MRKLLIRFLILFPLLGTGMQVCSQGSPIQPILTADSLSSGQWKDVLTSFLQLSFDKLTSDQKELNFQSNPYALLLRTNPEAAVDSNYWKYRTLRKLNFGFGLKLDTDYRFAGFTSGVRYAIRDDRDVTTSKWLFEKLLADSFRAEVMALDLALRDAARALYPGADSAKRRALLAQIDGVTVKRSAVSFAEMDPELLVFVNRVADSLGLQKVRNFMGQNPSKNLHDYNEASFTALKEELQKALLWTVSLSDTTYQDAFFFSNVLLQTELLKGIGRAKAGANWELNLRAGVQFTDDSTRLTRDLKRSVFRFDPGVNLLFRNGLNSQSLFEARLGGGYARHLGPRYAGERRDSLTLNLTLRIRVLADIWVPLEIRYDPRSGNVLGFLNIRANIKGLRKGATLPSGRD